MVTQIPLYLTFLTLINVGFFANSGQESMNFFRSRSRYSKTRYMRFSLWITSCSLHGESEGSQHTKTANHLLTNGTALLQWIIPPSTILDRTYPLLHKSKTTSCHFPLEPMNQSRLSRPTNPKTTVRKLVHAMQRGMEEGHGPDLTMLPWFISLRREISRIAVEGTPSSSCSRRIFLSAIVSLVTLSSALYTTPYVPSPIFSFFSYCTRTHTNAIRIAKSSHRIRTQPDHSLTCSIACPSATNAVAASAAVERRNKWGGEEEEGFGRMGSGLEGYEVGKSGSGNGGQSCCCHCGRLGLAVSSAAAAAGPRSRCGAIALACCCLLLCAV
jgi:hypothetical protein